MSSYREEREKLKRRRSLLRKSENRGKKKSKMGGVKKWEMKKNWKSRRSQKMTSAKKWMEKGYNGKFGKMDSEATEIMKMRFRSGKMEKKIIRSRLASSSLLRFRPSACGVESARSSKCASSDMWTADYDQCKFQ